MVVVFDWICHSYLFRSKTVVLLIHQSLIFWTCRCCICVLCFAKTSSLHKNHCQVSGRLTWKRSRRLQEDSTSQSWPGFSFKAEAYLLQPPGIPFLCHTGSRCTLQSFTWNPRSCPRKILCFGWHANLQPPFRMKASLHVSGFGKGPGRESTGVGVSVFFLAKTRRVEIDIWEP